MLVVVPPHALIKHWVYVLRNEQTPPPIFIGSWMFMILKHAVLVIII
ncbi:putative uracil phosphoribosyltransferase [Helianthus annuus]|nr:putative uracil phosphoribosyltransferase [Helianthus annuus]KAJ0759164.1 putative uracil phosphoribosyltransferase [Helianthus annuus]